MLIVVPITVLAIIAGKLGVYREIYIQDKSWLSFTILSIFIAATVWCGIQTYKLSANGLQFIWFVSDACLTIGMIGTIIGFLIMFSDGIVIVPGDIAGIQRLLSRFGVGVGTALYTTLVGLVCSLVLKLQLFNICHALGQIKDE
ncbi:MAG: MotA/TolQ/ExbB proton channel family protein [Nitrososphaerales archaeon]